MKPLRRITVQYFFMTRTQNLFAIIAVLLTTLMLASVFTVASNIITYFNAIVEYFEYIGIYRQQSIDPFTVGILIFASLLIAASGYLVIYSVFLLSLGNNIQFFGLLKCNGISTRQIKRIMWGQLLFVSVLGIPVGLLSGYLLGIRLTSVTLSVMAYAISVPITVNPFVFVLAAIFSFATLWVGCIKPIKIASSISPVEALKFNTSTGASDSKLVAKKTRNINLMSLAWVNISRKRRQLPTIITTLTISLVLLNSTVASINSFDLEKFVAASIGSDFIIGDVNLTEGSGFSGNFISSDTLHELSNVAGVESLSHVFYYRMSNEMESYSAQIYGVEEIDLATFSDVSYDHLSSGNYVIVSKQIWDYYDGRTIFDSDIAVPGIGDSIEIVNRYGNMFSFIVIGVVEVFPYHLSARYRIIHAYDLVIAAETFVALFCDTLVMQANLDVLVDNVPNVEEWLQFHTAYYTSYLGFISHNTLRRQFVGFQAIFISLGGVMATVFALVGLTNFVNSIAFSVMSRRREFAMLKSIGMSDKRLRMMIFLEGFYYTILTIFFSLTIGSLVSLLIVDTIAGQAWFFSRDFTVIPTILSMFPLALICIVVPYLFYRRVNKNTVSERLRQV